MCGGGGGGGGLGAIGAVVGAVAAYAMAPTTGGASVAAYYAMTGAALGGMAGNSYDQAQSAGKAASAQSEANDQAKAAASQSQENAKKQANLQEQEINRANAKTPNLSAMMDANKKATSVGGGAATLLTGPQGVKTSDLTLGGGSSTLLGS